MPLDDAVKYAAEDADITLRLWQLLKPQLHRAQVTTVYETLERPLVPVLAQMERNGIKVDRDTLSRMSNAFAQKMAGLEDEIHELAGRKFNVGSPKQLGEILFDEMGLEGGKKGKTGAYATGADVLEDLATEHDLPARVLDWRAAEQAEIDLYRRAAGPHQPRHGPRAHVLFHRGRQHRAPGLDRSEPAEHPVRSEEGRRIREAFVAEPGKTLVSARLLPDRAAHPGPCRRYRRAETGVPRRHRHSRHDRIRNVRRAARRDDPDIRRQAKAINFGVIYGISGFGLARNLRIPRAEAQGFIDRYFERFPGIRAYMDDTSAFAKEHGFVQTLFGRKIHTPEIAPRARAPVSPPRRDQRADPGHRRRRHPPRHDPHARRHRRAARENAASGA